MSGPAHSLLRDTFWSLPASTWLAALDSGAHGLSLTHMPTVSVVSLTRGAEFTRYRPRPWGAIVSQTMAPESVRSHAHGVSAQP
jgi:hypothetical protein